MYSCIYTKAWDYGPGRKAKRMGAAVYQWCEFKSRRGKNKHLTALKSNSNTVWFNFQTYIYIYIYMYSSDIGLSNLIMWFIEMNRVALAKSTCSCWAKKKISKNIFESQMYLGKMCRFRVIVLLSTIFQWYRGGQFYVR